MSTGWPTLRMALLTRAEAQVRIALRNLQLLLLLAMLLLLLLLGAAPVGVCGLLRGAAVRRPGGSR